jgi:hypothetical protein
MSKLWDDIRAGLREALGPRSVPTRMTEAQALEAARPTIDGRGGVRPEEEVVATVVVEDGRAVWSVKVMVRGAMRGGHLHIKIDDATGEVVKVFEVPY